MAKPQETKDKLRSYYVFDRHSLDVAALRAGVHYTTAKDWKKKALAIGDDWDRVRGATILAGGGQEQIAQQALTEMLVALQGTLDLVKVDQEMRPDVRAKVLASTMDAMFKGVSASRKYLPEANSLAIATIVMRGLIDHIKKSYPQHAPAFLEILPSYSKKLPKILEKAK